MKPRKADETEAHYIKRLEDCNSQLKKHNDHLTKWVSRINEAITVLSTEGSLAFQAMAEKAGVRSHPSVTQVVELFDQISHPQYRGGEEPMPEIKFPTFWDLDGPTAWSGDADMLLNSPISDTIDFLDSMKFSGDRKRSQYARELIGRLQQALIGRVDGIKTARGFKPKQIYIPSGHLNERSADELRDMIGGLTYMLLDLAQDMAFANEMLRRDLRAATYRRVCAELYRLAFFGPDIPEDTKFDIKIFGGENEPF